MKKLKELYQQSLQELCHTKTVVLCGLLAALAIVLSMVASIQLGPYIKIGFSGLPNRIVEFLFGPAVGCLFGGALDLLKYVLKPDGPFFFGFTFNAMLSGLIYGTLRYRRGAGVEFIHPVNQGTEFLRCSGFPGGHTVVIFEGLQLRQHI